MNVHSVICSSCGGTGRVLNLKRVSTAQLLVYNMSEAEENLCEMCNGAGYVEEVTFSIEQAKYMYKQAGGILEN